MIKPSNLFLISFCALLLVSSRLDAAKPFCLVDLYGTEYEDTSFEEEGFTSDELHEIHNYDLTIYTAFPRIKLSDNFSFIPRFDFQKKTFKYFLENQYLADHLPRHFRSAFLGFSTLIDFNDTWGLETYIAAGIESDHENTTNEDMKVKGSLMFNYNIEEDFQISLGAAYDTYLGEEEFIPQLGFWWMPNDLFYVNTVIPKFLEIAWTPTNRFHFGVEGEIRGAFYRLSDDPKKSFIESGIVKERFALAGIFTDFRIVKNLFLRASGGLRFAHTFKYYDMDDDDMLMDSDFEDVAYFQLALHWTVNGPFAYFD